MNTKQHLDLIWRIVLGGIAGELIGMILGRYLLSVEVLYVCIVMGIIIAALISRTVWNKISAVTRWITITCWSVVHKPKGLAAIPKAVFYIRTLFCFIRRVVGWCFTSLWFLFDERRISSLHELRERMLKLEQQRRWLCCENSTRKFLAESNEKISSPGLAQQIYSLQPGFAYCVNQWVFLLWFFSIGTAFTFISTGLYQFCSNLPDMLANALPILDPWKNQVSHSVLVGLWLLLILFASSLFLLLCRITIEKSAFGWATVVCFLLVCFPVFQFAMQTIIDLPKEESVPAVEFIQNHVINRQPIIFYFIIVYSILGMLFACGQNVFAGNYVTGNYRVFPPLRLFACVLFLIYCKDMLAMRFLSEAFLFTFLFAVTGNAFHFVENEKSNPKWRWLLIPLCCIIAGIIFNNLETPWYAQILLAAAIFIPGFMIAAKKNLHTLVWCGVFSILTITVCQVIRECCADVTDLMTIFTIWSAIGVWVVYSQLAAFDARAPLYSFIRKKVLQIRYASIGFGKSSLLETEWYKHNVNRQK